jgi:hypothetical protein
MKLIDNSISINDINNINPDSYLDFKELNINKEFSFVEILSKLKSIISENNNWYTETKILRECIINIRKITCRNLNRDNTMLIENKIHILLFKLLEYYQAYVDYTQEEISVIVI